MRSADLTVPTMNPSLAMHPCSLAAWSLMSQHEHVGYCIVLWAQNHVLMVPPLLQAMAELGDYII